MVSGYRKHLKDKCEICDLNDKRLLVIHHKDRDRDNNNPSNLQTTCYNCHRLIHWTHMNKLKNKLPEIYEDGDVIEYIFPNPIKSDYLMKMFLFSLGHRKGNGLFLREDMLVGFRCHKDDFNKLKENNLK